MMGDIVLLFDKSIIANNKFEITNCERTLKLSLEKKKLLEIEQTIQTNEEPTRKFSQRQNFRKFNNLKHNPPKNPAAANDGHVEEPKWSYSRVVKSNVIPP